MKVLLHISAEVQVRGTTSKHYWNANWRTKDESSKKRHFEGLLLVTKLYCQQWPLVQTKDAGDGLKKVPKLD